MLFWIDVKFLFEQSYRWIFFEQGIVFVLI